MKLRLEFMALVVIAEITYLCQHEISSLADSGQEIAPRPRTASNSSRFVGAGSCAAAACHNGSPENSQVGREYATWITRDRHAQAYEVLFSDRSQSIQTLLHAKRKAHEDLRCLTCHVSPDLNADVDKTVPYFRTDGVSCESCHGPAEKWLSVHHLEAWKQITPMEKQRHGMNDTQSLLGRAQVCVKCHVGAPGMDVDHDLLAAGHPRLNFEFAAFHAMMPHHWPDAKDRDPKVSTRGRPDFEARAWAVGQLVTAQAALDLLADRASDHKKPWPEFAEYDCSACHHNLTSPSNRPQQPYGKRRQSALPWGTYVTLTPQILESLNNGRDPQLLQFLSSIKTAMDSGNVDRKELASKSTAAAILLSPWQAKLERKLFGPSWVDSLCQSIQKTHGLTPASNHDAQTQASLSLAALYQAHNDMWQNSHEGARNALLRFSKTTINPGEYEPEAIRKRLLEFKNIDTKERREK